MKNRRLRRTAALLAALLLALSGCGSQTEQGEELEALTIATMPSVDKVPILVAQQQGFFQAHGLTVTLQNYQSPTDRNAALEAGAVDGLMSDMVAFNLYLETGAQLRMTSSIQTEFALLASPASGITAGAPLPEDAVCGIAQNCLMQYLADTAGATNQLPLPDVAVRTEQILSGGIDLTVVPEPYGALAVQRGAVLLERYAGAGAVLLFTEEALEQRPEAVAAFYAGIADAVAWLETADPADWLDAVVEEGGFAPDAAQYLAQVDYRPLTAPDAAQWQAVQTWMNEAEAFQGPYNVPYADAFAAVTLG